MYGQYLPLASFASAQTGGSSSPSRGGLNGWPSSVVSPQEEWNATVFPTSLSQPKLVAAPSKLPQLSDAPSGGSRSIERDVSTSNIRLGIPPVFTKKSVSSPFGGLSTASA